VTPTLTDDAHLRALRSDDLRALLEFSAELQAVERLNRLQEALLPALLRLVDADLVGWNDVDLADGSIDGLLYPDRAAGAACAELRDVPEEPPLLTHFRHHPDALATRTGDVCGQREWRACAAYVEVYRRYEVETQLAVPVAATSDRFYAISFNRSRFEFSDRDSAVLSAAQPHVAGAFRRLCRSSAREAAMAALGADCGWVLLDGAGLVVDAGPVAAGLLSGQASGLEVGRPLGALPADLVVRRIDGSGAAFGDHTVLLAVRPACRPETLGLTRRQYQALCAVADGTPVRLAARRLGISPQTLATHLRDAYGALGVGGRLAAINVLRERGLVC
jgi:DNA-binding CsgD family transcriptional regulator